MMEMPQVQFGLQWCATVSEAMVRSFHKHPSWRVFYHLEENDTPLLELDAPNAAFEYEY